MTEHEQERFEAELRQIKPARLPEELSVRLRTVDLAGTARAAKTPAAGPVPVSSVLLHLVRWLIPVAAVFLIVAAIWRSNQGLTQQSDSKTSPEITATTDHTPLKADNVQIEQELVSSFDTVATLPGGEPVRFRVQQWRDQVVVDDKSQGLLVESRMPRVVVVPVRFETY